MGMALLEWLDYLLESFFRTPDPKDPISWVIGFVESLCWLWDVGIVIDGALLCMLYPLAFFIILTVLIVIVVVIYFHNTPDPHQADHPLRFKQVSFAVLASTFLPLYIAMGILSRRTLLTCIAVSMVLYLMVCIRIWIIRRRENQKKKELNSSNQQKFHKCVLL